MRKTDEHLIKTARQINGNLAEIKPDKLEFYSSNILKFLRDLVETVVVKLAGEEFYSHDKFDEIKSKIFGNGKYKFLGKFHKLLQRSASHYTEIEDSATRLLFIYYGYLVSIKDLLKKKYNIEILPDLYRLEKYINKRKDLFEYYEKVAGEIEKPTSFKIIKDKKKYYIDYVKSFPVNGKIYYEVAFRLANDYTSKFDRVIAFSKKEIKPNYAVELTFRKGSINLFGKKIPVDIIEDYRVSIRPCELNNFAKLLFGESKGIKRSDREYKVLMNLLKKSDLDLLDIVVLPEERYIGFKKYLSQSRKGSKIIPILNKIREIIMDDKPGANVLRYLLFNLRNSVIKKQLGNESNSKMSWLYIRNGAIPFDRLPFNFSLIEHIPRFWDIFYVIGAEGREDELFARFIKNKSEIEGKLYTDVSEAKSFEEINKLIESYNNKVQERLISSFYDEKLDMFGNKIFIRSYEKKTIEIMQKLKEISKLGGIKSYSQDIERRIEENNIKIDDPIKKRGLINMFDKSRFSLIYGSAGTGKTKMIEYISSYFGSKGVQVTLLANTHTAVSNLERRVENLRNIEFSTVSAYIKKAVKANDKVKTGVLIVDEASTVSNKDMYDILQNVEFKVLVIVGDIYQIDAIRFGNWFYLAKHFFPSNIIELQETRRTNDKGLLNLWNTVRNIDEKGWESVEEIIRMNGYASYLDESVFDKQEDDEIILCLNYNGLYGINNINKILQQRNPNKPFEWGVNAFKVGDPIIFSETRRFGNILHNNLKGVIREIEVSVDEGGKKKIWFNVEVEKLFDEIMLELASDIELIEIDERKGTSIVKFYVEEPGDMDSDSNENQTDIIPFQIAYALSIHKAQGLEFDSVKIIITDEVEDKITHSIFYTAITRAKKKLRIYWSPQTQTRVLANLKPRFSKEDYYILNNKYGKLLV